MRISALVPGERPLDNFKNSLTWSVAAAISLLTSRSILVSVNWHYPLHLLVLQLVIVTTWTLISRSRTRASSKGRFSDHERPSGRRQWATFLLNGESYAVSLPLYSQAILHFSNTPILAMLSVLVFLPSAGLGSFLSPTTHRVALLRRLGLIILAVFFILFFEYRLTVNGLVFGILGTGLFGILQTLSHLVDEEAASSRRGLNDLPTLCLLLFSSLVIALAVDDTPSALTGLLKLSFYGYFVLLFNLTATTVAIILAGQGFVWNSDDSRVTWRGYQTPETIWPVICLVGLVSAYCVGFGLTIVHPSQSICFLMAALAFVDADLGTSSWTLGPGPGQVQKVIRTLAKLVPSPSGSRNRGIPRAVADDLDEEEDGNPISATGTLLQSQDSEPSQSSLPTRILICSTVLCWIITFWLSVTNHTSSWPAYHEPNLDRTYTPPSQFDIVISMYNEPLTQLTATLNLILSIPTIATLKPRLFIYTKDYRADLDAILHATASPLLTGSPSITIKENIGREGETHLHHIIAHYDTLAAHTLFTQAETHNPRELRPRIADYFRPAHTGFLSLGFEGVTCPCEATSCGDRFWRDDSGAVRQTYLKANRLQQCPASGRILLSYKGQFVASARRIRGVELAEYEYLHKLFVDQESFVHQPEYLGDRKDDMSAPVFGFTMERMWSALMQCSEERVALRCPSLLSGWRLGGGRGDCQCFDTENEIPA